ncbi:MAG: TatD family hydrolase [Acidobacteria bacterium]|nr:TatD family hydrolase [Acidobacteriota bacterium]
MLVDSHCHIEGPEFASDRSEVLQRAEAAGIGRILCIGSGDWSRGSMSQAVELAEQCELVDASIGIHPHDAECYDERVEACILSVARHPTVVGWGEIGLDYHYQRADRDTQLKVFRRQLELAYQWQMPVIIHSREAEQDTLQLLREVSRLPLAGVMHCYGGSWDMARGCMDLGFLISFAGNVTYRKATVIQDAARRVPLDYLLVETDAPYLSPMPVRGKRNEPAHVQYIVRFLEGLRGESCQRVEEATAENYFRLFKRAATGKRHGNHQT